MGTSFHISMTQGSVTYSWPVSFALFEGVFDAPSDKKAVTLKPFNTAGTSGTKFDIKWPRGVPLVGDGSLNFWTPSLPNDMLADNVELQIGKGGQGQLSTPAAVRARRSGRVQHSQLLGQLHGRFLYWPQSREEDVDRVWTSDGAEDAKERPASYQIMACRLRGETFSDPFVVADLANDTDILAVLNTTRGATIEMLRTEFVATTDDAGRPHFTDEEGNPIYNASNIWYTSVPSVLCVTAIACEAVNPLVNPGDTTTFHVALRNDGNTYLSGCSLTLCSHNKDTDSYEREESTTTTIAFGPDSLQESHWNPRGEDGNLQNVEDDYALCPGKTSVYSVDVTFLQTGAARKRSSSWHTMA